MSFTYVIVSLGAFYILRRFLDGYKRPLKYMVIDVIFAALFFYLFYYSWEILKKMIFSS